MSETQRSFKDEIRRRLARLGLPPERETDIVDELAQHLEARHADLVRAGRPEAEAYRIVVAEIGGHEAWAQLSERRPPEPIPLGDGGSGLTLSHVWRDVRFGARMLRRHPGFTAVAALTLALGIGANTAIFTVVNAVMLRPLPFADPDRLVNVYENNLSRGWPAFGVSHPNFLDWRDTAKSFDRLAAWRGQSFSVTSGGAAELVDGAGVTDGFFPLLGVTPALGRNFLPEEDRPGGRRAAILGHGFWLRRFGGDPSAVGRTLTLTDDTYVIVGVLPRTFRWSGAEVYVPLAPDPQRGRGDHRLNVMGRLRPGVTVEQARGEMVAIARGLEQSYPDTNRGWSVALEPIFDAAVPEQIRRALLLLLAAAALVLLIATSNVANLSLARAAARQREIAIRVALGAQRKRIVAQLLVESSLLALGAGLVGLLIAVLATQALRAGASGIPRMDEISIDARVVGFALLVSSAAAVLFGVIPALQAARPSPHGSLALTDGRGGGARVRGRLRDAIVVAEVALSVALLSGAGEGIGLAAARLFGQRPQNDGLDGRREIGDVVARRRRLFADVLHRQADAVGLRLQIINLPDQCTNEECDAIMSDFVMKSASRAIECMACRLTLEARNIQTYYHFDRISCTRAQLSRLWSSTGTSSISAAEEIPISSSTALAICS